MQKGAVLLCADMVGAGQRVLEITVDYSRTRIQFDMPIGINQYVQDHCVNLLAEVDAARWITYEAVWKISAGLPCELEMAMAKAWTSEASRRVTFLGHQIHGAVSFCEEHDMHLYYRKAKAGEVAFGDGTFHLEKVAQHLGL